MYIQSSDRAWSPILLNIILTETDLYLSWRVPDLTWTTDNKDDKKDDQDAFTTYEELTRRYEYLLLSYSHHNTPGLET